LRDQAKAIREKLLKKGILIKKHKQQPVNPIKNVYIPQENPPKKTKRKKRTKNTGGHNSADRDHPQLRDQKNRNSSMDDSL
jgi:hypothetical protein